MQYFKIRSKETGLYRTASGGWNKSGKTYDTLGKLRTFLTNTMRRGRRGGPGISADWEIITYEVTELAAQSPHLLMKPEKIMEMIDGKKR